MEKGLGAVVPCLFGCALALALAGCQLPRESPAPPPESQAPLAMAEETVNALRARYAQGAIDKADLLRAELVAAQVRLWGTPRADQAAYASACAATLGKLEAIRAWADAYAKGFGDELPLRRVEDFPSCNLFVRRAAFEAVGGFREDFWPGEDTLLCADLQRAGHTLWYDPRLVVWHHRRPVFGPHLRQIGRYALHRGFFARRVGLNSRRLSYHLPSLFLLGLVGGFPLAWLSPWLAVPYCAVVGLYLLVTVADAAVEAPAPRLFLPLWWGIVATHLVYGARFLQGWFAAALPNAPRPFDHR